MTATTARHTLSGTIRSPIAGAHAIAVTHPDERIEVTVRVRRKAPILRGGATGNFDDRHPGKRAYLSREQHAAVHGAAAADLDAVAAFGRAHGLAVVESSSARRSVVLSGPANVVASAFGVTLEQFEHDGGVYRSHSGAISVPGELADVIEGVFGLDNRPAAVPHIRRLAAAAAPAPAAAPPGSFTPPALAQLYGFPTGLDGSGQCIGIIELGGGYRPADLRTYFQQVGVTSPTVSAVLVGGAHNHPSTGNSADGEVMLDIEVVGAVAPGASIVVYFAPNTDQGFLNAITTAIHDTTHRPSIISISWGQAESGWSAQAMTSMDQAFQSAANMGVTICVASGDNGSGDSVNDGKPHVDFPASSPHVLGCGGTKLVAAGTAIGSEVVWNEGAQGGAGGGGVSGFFPLPNWQETAGVPTIPGTSQTGRGVPDVAGDADPNSGYQVRVDGQNLVIGGTSAVAPLWAGLLALINQSLGQPVGFLQPLLYGSLAGKGVFNDITQGDNGAYAAGTGWDACTGWGSPRGSSLLQALKG